MAMRLPKMRNRRSSFPRAFLQLHLIVVVTLAVIEGAAAAFSTTGVIKSQLSSSRSYFLLQPRSPSPVVGFNHHQGTSQGSSLLENRNSQCVRLDVSSLKDNNKENVVSSFDPLNFGSVDAWDGPSRNNNKNHEITGMSSRTAAALATLTALPVLLADEASAAMSRKSIISTGEFNPETFKPVCPASDGFYRFLQGTTQAVVGDENFLEYGPLIAGGLLRVRLELCVVESFFNEAVGPFINQNGLSWILPIHETVETFIAGTIFALATTFILVGSTKIISVIVTYGDAFVGGPCRLFGGFAFDRARGKPVTLDIGIGPWKTRVVGPPDNVSEMSVGGEEKLIDFENVDPVKLFVILTSGAVKAVGEASRILRELIDALDLFVGKYLTLLATGYIGLKFLHFKVFPDFPPF